MKTLAAFLFLSVACIAASTGLKAGLHNPDNDCMGPHGPQPCPADTPRASVTAGGLGDLDCLGPAGPQPCPADAPRASGTPFLG